MPGGAKKSTGKKNALLLSKYLFGREWSRYCYWVRWNGKKGERGKNGGLVRDGFQRTRRSPLVLDSIEVTGNCIFFLKE